jgi:hypothetical protein
MTIDRTDPIQRTLSSHAISRLFPNASPDVLARNSRTPTKLERCVGDAPLEAGEVQDGTGGRVLIRVTSIRKRLLDEDNLCEKYHVDLCRYAGILSGDEAGKTKIEVRQVKAGKEEQERTLIEVFSLQPNP